jgi:hypothetical protein
VPCCFQILAGFEEEDGENRERRGRFPFKKEIARTDEDDPLIICHYSRFCPRLRVISFPLFAKGLSRDSKGQQGVLQDSKRLVLFANDSKCPMPMKQYYLVIWKRIAAFRYYE